MLVEHGADVSAQDEDGRTPLHWASSRGDVDVARMLVERGADTDTIFCRCCITLADPGLTARLSSFKSRTNVIGARHMSAGSWMPIIQLLG